LHLPEIDKYAHLDSPLRRWDARVKLACLSVMLLAVALSPTHVAALVGLALASGLVLLSRIPLSFVFVHLRWVLLFCLFLLVVMPVRLAAGGSDTFWRAGPIALSGHGLSRATLIALRATGAMLLVYPMFGTARFHVSLKALRRLRVPLVIVQILAFTYRYVFVLLDEAARMLAAARARGLGRAGALRTFKCMGYIIGMLFVRSFERTQRVYMAMLARGYRGEVRTLDEFHLRSADLLKGALALGATALLITVGLVS